MALTVVPFFEDVGVFPNDRLDEEDSDSILICGAVVSCPYDSSNDADSDAVLIPAMLDRCPFDMLTVMSCFVETMIAVVVSAPTTLIRTRYVKLTTFVNFIDAGHHLRLS